MLMLASHPLMLTVMLIRWDIEPLHSASNSTRAAHNTNPACVLAIAQYLCMYVPGVPVPGVPGQHPRLLLLLLQQSAGAVPAAALLILILVLGIIRLLSRAARQQHRLAKVRDADTSRSAAAL